MDFLSREFNTQRLLFISTLMLLVISLAGCTGALEPKHVASFPLVMLQETPIPEQAKHRDSQTQTLDKDASISLWFIGTEGWQTDALARALKRPAMLQAKESYFEAYFESFFFNILSLNYESARLRGHWVKMVPQDLPPIILSPVMETTLPAPSTSEEQP